MTPLHLLHTAPMENAHGGLSLRCAVAILCNFYIQLIERRHMLSVRLKASVHERVPCVCLLYTCCIQRLWRMHIWSPPSAPLTAYIDNTHLEASPFSVQLLYTPHIKKANALSDWRPLCMSVCALSIWFVYSRCIEQCTAFILTLGCAFPYMTCA